MTISLTKGSTLSLAKNAGLDKVVMGLGWDAAKSGGLMGRLFGGGGGGGAIDLDASVLVYDGTGAILDTVWFRQLRGMGGAIRHSGDNRTGDGDGDDETISVDLGSLPANVVSLVFTVNSFSGQNFSAVDNAVCRLVDARDGKELCRYVLSEKGRHTGVFMAVLTRRSGSWEIRAIGETMSGRTVQDMAREAIRHI
ncbi:TerD family protein [Paracoccus sp. ME4]|uniref:TerD family protein n=1 Tax=Paracoccus sp. ME4 TaxID=3138066 RepID=UPI00398B8FBF